MSTCLYGKEIKENCEILGKLEGTSFLRTSETVLPFCQICPHLDKAKKDK